MRHKEQQQLSQVWWHGGAID